MEKTITSLPMDLERSLFIAVTAKYYLQYCDKVNKTKQLRKDLFYNDEHIQDHDEYGPLCLSDQSSYSNKWCRDCRIRWKLNKRIERYSRAAKKYRMRLRNLLKPELKGAV